MSLHGLAEQAYVAASASARVRLVRRAATLHQYVDPRRSLAYSHGHALMRTGPWLWCLRCGAHMQRFARGLGKPCPGALSGSGRSARARLEQGRHPTSGLVTPWRAQRLSREQWESLQAGERLEDALPSRAVAVAEGTWAEARRQEVVRWQALVDRVRSREHASRPVLGRT